MAVTIDSGPITAVDLIHHVPRQKWRELMLARERFCAINLSYDCRCLVQFINDAELMYSELGFTSADDMVRNGYGLKPEEINIAVAWLKLHPSNEPLPLEQAVKLGKHGRPKKGEEKGRIPTFSKRGREYDLARLDRDHSELAAKVRSGAMSANAAAQAAGIRKKPTSFDIVMRHVPKLTDAEWQEVIRARRKIAA